MNDERRQNVSHRVIRLVHVDGHALVCTCVRHAPLWTGFIHSVIMIENDLQELVIKGHMCLGVFANMRMYYTCGYLRKCACLLIFWIHSCAYERERECVCVYLCVCVCVCLCVSVSVSVSVCVRGVQIWLVHCTSAIDPRTNRDRKCYYQLQLALPVSSLPYYTRFFFFLVLKRSE